jgi:hypothetical protein
MSRLICLRSASAEEIEDVAAYPFFVISPQSRAAERSAQ